MSHTAYTHTKCRKEHLCVCWIIKCSSRKHRAVPIFCPQAQKLLGSRCIFKNSLTTHSTHFLLSVFANRAQFLICKDLISSLMKIDKCHSEPCLVSYKSKPHIKSTPAHRVPVMKSTLRSSPSRA
jgi:hypothetical protein